MWRPIQSTKEPYRHVIWGIRGRICSKKRVWEHPKHCTKECRKRVTVHVHGPGATLASALSRRVGSDVVRLPDGTHGVVGPSGSPLTGLRSSPRCSTLS